MAKGTTVTARSYATAAAGGTSARKKSEETGPRAAHRAVVRVIATGGLLEGLVLGGETAAGSPPSEADICRCLPFYRSDAAKLQWLGPGMASQDSILDVVNI